MAHPQQFCFVQTFANHISASDSQFNILEIGSYDVNGSVRELFPGSTYCGVDLTPGEGVDVVADGHRVDHPNNSYDITISCECFEHNPAWLETFHNMYRMTKAGGFIVVTCATTGRVEHGTRRTTPKASPGTQQQGWDYYRNIPVAHFRKLMNFDEMFQDHRFFTNTISHDLYFVGRKHGADVDLTFDLTRFSSEHADAQRALEQKLAEERSGVGNALMHVYRATQWPVQALTFLPEPVFQTFAVYYNKAVMGLVRPVEATLRRVMRVGPPVN
ncbi:MAG: class I SAM-dependent methyltransferase [Hyphomicrobiales bacterium]